MHATHAHADPACPKSGLICSKDAERHRNRLHYRATVAEVCEQLVTADLTATSYRVALDLLARMLRLGSTTEAVGNEWVASRLHVGRNAVSTAYSALEACGFLRRMPVKHRGAPTRTRLISVPASLVDGSIPIEAIQLLKDAVLSQAPAARPNLVLVTEEGNPAQSAPAGPADPNLEETGITAAQVDQAPVEAVAVEEVLPHEPFVFNASVNASMAAKVPADIRLAITQARSPSPKDFPVMPAWDLSEDETRHYLAMFPKPEPKPKPARKDNLTGEPILPMTPDPDMVAALAYAHPRLKAIVGSDAAAAQLGDQIAFQVMYGSLGGGDRMVGIRAGVSLVAKGRWTEPREFAWFKAQWGGITVRALIKASHG